jgi:serine protease Do
MDGRPLHSVIDFYVKMIHKEVGEPIQLKYVRNQQDRQRLQTVELTLLPRPLPDGRRLAQQYFQMAISPLTADVARRFDFENAYPILIVTDVAPDGAADRAGVRSGDLILQVNRVTVRDVEEFSREMEKVSESDVVEFKILRITMGLFGQIDRQYYIPVPTRRSPGR